MHSTSPHYHQLQPEDRMVLASLAATERQHLGHGSYAASFTQHHRRELSRNADATGCARLQGRLHAEASFCSVWFIISC
jgi:hypothetical protein